MNPNGIPPKLADWSAFDGFKRPIALKSMSWTGVGEWTSTLEQHLGVERAWLHEQRLASDELLRDLGGDPTATDWTLFRPLRRDREEDWSDWLAQLLSESSTGVFASLLFGSVEQRSIDSYQLPVVHREVAYEGYRADLVVEWSDSSYTHAEVKVGDPNLAKTLETSHKMERRFSNLLRRSDAVLLLESQEDAWQAACVLQKALHERVHCLTWNQIAVALRRSLSSRQTESTRWRVWAHAFCGAIEQDLLQIGSGREPGEWTRSLRLGELQVAVDLFRKTESADA